MIILAIDPGPTKSAWLTFDTETDDPVNWGHDTNEAVLDNINYQDVVYAERLVLEQVAAMGMDVGKDVFETVFWTGRFFQGWNERMRYSETREKMDHADRIKRMEVKMHICHDSRAKDKNIRQSIIDMYGGDIVAITGAKCSRCKDGMIGGKKRGRPCDLCTGDGWETRPGPLAGISTHAWAALALAITYADKLKGKA